jgi:hypothetical protein
VSLKFGCQSGDLRDFRSGFERTNVICDIAAIEKVIRLWPKTNRERRELVEAPEAQAEDFVVFSLRE